MQAVKLTPVAALLVSLFYPSQVLAADASTEKTEKDIEVIEISGTRGSLNKALNEKRFNDAMVDVISNEDIGVMPDPDIGDSLQRVAGVQVQRGENGVAREVTIRGLPGHMSKVLYNGRTITTPINDNRNFSFQIIPSAFVSSAVVQKSSSADLAEGGIAGTVNLKSHRALNYKKSVTKLITKASYQGNNGDVGPDFSILHSSIFADDSIGFTLGLNHLEQNIGNQLTTSSNPNVRNYTEAKLNADLNQDGDLDDKVYGPSQVRIQYQQSHRTRNSAFANFEWRPEGGFSLFAETFYTEYDMSENRDRYMFTPANGTKLVADDLVLTQANGYDYLGVIHGTNIGSTVDATPVDRKSEIQVSTLELKYESDNWQVTAGVNVADSNLVWNSILLQSKLPTMDVTLDGLTDGAYDFIYADADASAVMLLDQSNYTKTLLNAAQLNTLQENNSTSYNLDFKYFLEQDFGPLYIESVSIGASYSEEELLKVRPTAKLNATQFSAFLAENQYEVGFNPVLVEQGEWFDGAQASTHKPLPWLSQDIDHFLSTFSVADIKAAAEAAGTYKPGFREDLFEDNSAFYLRTDFAIGDKLNGNIGVRYVETDQVSQGNGADVNGGFVDEGDGLYSLRVVGEQIARNNNYSEWLPSLNLTYSLADDHVIRFGAAKTLARPDKSDLSVAATFNSETRVLNTSDPELQPFISNNLDLSYQWYFQPQSLLSVSLFKKELESLVNKVEFDKAFDIYNGSGEIIGQDIITVKGEGNAQGVELSGYELSYQQPFDFLPGFLKKTGVKMNYTYIHNSEPELLPAASEDNYNIIAYYSDKTIDARIAYSYRGEYLKTTASDLVPETYFDEAKYMTLSLAYKPMRKMRISLSVSNLTDEPSYVYNQNGTSRAFNDFGRRINAGISYSF